jgi:diguanylate cyclase (GGDEF)-like protein
MHTKILISHMKNSHELLRSIINSVSEHIVTIDREGIIQFVNRAWVEFGQNNDCSVKNEHEWHGVNYLTVCDRSTTRGDEPGANKAAEGIRRVIKKELASFSIEYPCHGPDQKRWFVMKVTSFQLTCESYYVISHQNISARKLAEEVALNLSHIDGLTKIPNRRYFDKFLKAEWKRCSRLNLPIIVAIMDIDHFKLLNDHYGHQTGDECLVIIGTILKRFGKRPGDLLARFGGEEFSLVFGNTTIERSMVIINRIISAIAARKIPNEKSPVKPIVTVSVGLAMMYPDRLDNVKALTEEASNSLYSAKANGRNGMVFNYGSKQISVKYAESSSNYWEIIPPAPIQDLS